MTATDWWAADLIACGADDLPWARARRTVTRGELRDQVARLRSLFGRLGVGPGSTVSLYGVLSFTQLWALFAVWACGAQAVVVDPRLRGARLEERLESHRPQFLVTFGGPGEVLGPFRDECEIVFRRLPGGRPARSDHPLIHFTSGTTGAAKAIGRTAASLRAELAAIGAIPGMPGRGDRVLLLESAVYSFGLIGGVLSGTGRGAVTLFATDHRPDLLARVAAETAATAILGNPRHFAGLAAAPEAPPLPALRLAVSSGESLPRGVYDRFAERYGVRIGQAYGLTETGIVAAQLTGEHGPCVVGPPVSDVRVRIAGGELQVSAPASTVDGEPRWLRTHDLATRDPATGLIRLHGRVDAADSPASPVDLVEIEAVLRAHEHVHEVVVLAGKEIEAYVEAVRSLRPADLISWCRRHLHADRVPARCHLVPAIPRTLNGKLVRDRARLVR